MNNKGLLAKIHKVIKNPYIIIVYLNLKGMLNFVSDEAYLKAAFRANSGRKLNLNNPITFNEKLQWLKLYDRNPLYTKLADKYEVRKYIASTIGEEYLVPLLGVWNNANEIDFDKLPNQFVLKCTHDSGSVIICKDKKTINKESIVKHLEKCMKKNYYWQGREWAYKGMKPRIIAEKYLIDSMFGGVGRP